MPYSLSMALRLAHGSANLAIVSVPSCGGWTTLPYSMAQDLEIPVFATPERIADVVWAAGGDFDLAAKLLLPS